MAQRQSKKAPSGKGATSRNKSKSGGDGFHIPGWLWALVGIIAGFAIAQYFQNDAPPKRDQVAAVVAKKRADGGDQQKGSESASTAEEKDQMPTFEFYTLLPESEVIAPNVEDYNSAPRPGTEGAVLEQHAKRIAGNSSSASVSHPESKTTSQKSATSSSSEKSSADSGDAIQQMASRHEASSSRQSAPARQQSASSAGSGPSYMLQAASFKSQSDANNMAGKLRDLGLVMQVTQVKTADNTTWYRVQAGPYRDSGELARARGLMQTRGIDPMQIQQR
ncbi:SPOR domain-containing protein [Kushneria marisflavi]|uniref:Uncharacterized protein n=1 Tax=Kushneria marisflavi TaxID=157779 RepID=A0A240UQP2_9GAMM|nr:SPOR domain-containing protein [Kushneria marisflavi]ART63798.1 hypothetical protein B9H00_12645 [Kushneria marisflavi]RKD85493.1 sporulation related protein [Kushneria marisflavi]